MYKIYYTKDKIFNNSMTTVVSYLSTQIEDCTFIEFDYMTYFPIEDSENVYVLFSIDILTTFYFLLEFLNRQNLKFAKVVIGGSSLLVVHNYLQIFKIHRSITHVCVGPGEEFMVDLLTKNLPSGIYYGNNFKKIKRHFISNVVFLKNLPLIHLGMNYTSCSWGKCLFCSEANKPLNKEYASLDEIASIINFYRNVMNKKTFYISDSFFTFESLQKLLEKLEYGPKIDLMFFGMRVSDTFLTVDPKLLLREDIQLWITWGHEFYDDEILDIYKKGITTDEIFESVQWCFKYSINTHSNLIVGMPLVTNRNIYNHYSFYSNYEKYSYSPTGPGNFFMLYEHSKMFKMLDQFKIKLENRCTLQDQLKLIEFSKIHNTSYIELDLTFFRFYSYDEDSKKYITRKEALMKHEMIYQSKRQLNQDLFFSSHSFMRHNVLSFDPRSPFFYVFKNLL